MDKKSIKNIFVVILIILCCTFVGYSIDKHSWTAFSAGVGCFVSAIYLTELEE